MTTGLRTKTVQDEDWHIEFCDFSAAWALAPPRPEGKQEGEGVVVVHPDTGYTDHPEIKSDRYLTQAGKSRNFLKGYELRPEVRSAEDDLTGSSASHGTKTASLLMSGKGPPNAVEFPNYAAAKAIWGVAPKVEVIPFRVTKWVNLTDATTLALGRAILYAATKMNAQEVGVISISLGRSSFWGIEGKSKMIDALKEARKNGIVVCAAAGQLQQLGWDSDWGTPAFPARDANAICVAGCRPEPGPNYPAIPSGFLGSEVDITAPAFDLWIAKSVRGSPSPSYEIEQSWGTSYATAIIAGACALWQAYHGRSWLLDPTNYGPELVFPLFKLVLKRSAFKPQGWDSANRGVGVLDAKALLEEPLPTKAEVEAAAANGN